jgi:hypothetical protein
VEKLYKQESFHFKLQSHFQEVRLSTGELREYSYTNVTLKIFLSTQNTAGVNDAQARFWVM